MGIDIVPDPERRKVRGDSCDVIWEAPLRNARIPTDQRNRLGLVTQLTADPGTGLIVAGHGTP